MLHDIQSTLLTILLAFGAQAPSQTTPRALLERGALAEEHQRDFAGAQKLYEQAEAAAKAAGDAKTAAEASAAKERVLVRQGKGAPTAQAQDAAVQAQLRERALTMLFKAQSDLPSIENLIRAAQQLADLGPSVTEMLALSLTDSISADGKHKPPHAPWVAARALARMQSLEADRALAAAYASPDPTIRKAVIEAASAPRFLELHLRAASDSVASIQALAIAHLLGNDDKRAAPHIQELAKTDDFTAHQWLAGNAPEASVALAEDTTLSSSIRRNILIQFSKGVGKPFRSSSGAASQGAQPSSDSDERVRMPSELVVRLVKIVAAAGDNEKDLRGAAWQAARALEVVQPPQHAAILAELEPLLLRMERLGDDASAAGLLERWKSPRAVEAVRAALERRQSDPAPSDLVQLFHTATRLIESSRESIAFATWLELVNASSTQWPPISARSSVFPFTFGLLADVDLNVTAASLGDWLGAWKQAPASHELEYARIVKRRLDQALKEPAGSALPEQWKPFAKRLFASDDAEMVRTALDLVRHQLAYEFVGEIVHSQTRISLVDLQQSTFQALYASSPVQTLAALEAQLLEGVRASWPSLWSALQLLYSLNESDTLECWRKLWDASSRTASREALLQFLVEWPQAKASAAKVLVELYPTLESDFPQFRSRALQCFGRTLLDAALPILERELRSPDVWVRKSAMEAADAFRKHREAIAEFDAWRKTVTVEQSTVAELSKLLESPNRDVVLGAVKALAILRARPALPALVKLLERDDKELRAAVQAALDAIGGS